MAVKLLFGKKRAKKQADLPENGKNCSDKKNYPEKIDGEQEQSLVKDDHPEGPSPSPSGGGGFYKRLRRGLEKTRKLLTTDVDKLFSAGKKIDEDALETLEELLITSDIGVKTATELISKISKKASRITDPETLKAEMKNIILSGFQACRKDGEGGDIEPEISGKPHVIMIVGVNGVGKTTTIGKLSARYASCGKKVLFAAADTFRAAAIDQLAIWAERTGADIVKHRENSDPAAVAYDAVNAALARGIDVVMVDTAGRLHTRVNLMEELKKIKRSIGKALQGAPHEVLLVLDATTGQNALSQTDLFAKATEITGIVLTKLDGTAKGGIAINLDKTFGIPIKYIGVGEQVDDLQPFDPEAFVDALF